MLTKRTYFFLVLFTCVLGLSALLGLAFLAEDGVQARELLPSTHAGVVFINELCAKNTAFMSRNGRTPDLIELYNDGGGAVSLDGWYMEFAGEKHAFTDVTLGAGEFLVIYCSSQLTDFYALDVNMAFDIPVSGGRGGISLHDAEGLLVDTLVYPPLSENRSWARVADGGDAWIEMDMTIGHSNHDIVLSAVELAPSTERMYGGGYNG